METYSKLWTGALVAVAMTIGSIASAATVLDDFSVAFTDGAGHPFIGVSGEVNGGATANPLVFQDISSVGVGSFDARRTATLTHAGPIELDEESSLRITPATNALRFENSSGQNLEVDFLLTYDDFGFSSGGGQTLDLSTWNTFQFSVVSTNVFTTPPSLPVTFTVFDVAGFSSSVHITGVGSYEKPFSSFGGVDLTQVSRIDFGFSNTDGSNIFGNLDIRFSPVGLDGGAVIPLPSSAGLILLGMVGLGFRRLYLRK
jgi:hypothetical protein